MPAADQVGGVAATVSPSELKDLVVAAIEELKGQRVVALDVTRLTDVMDYMVIASGSSSRHVRSLAEHVREQARGRGVRPLGVEGLADGDWALLDLGDVVAHLMLPATREFYDLERLWSGVPEPETARSGVPEPETARNAAPEPETAPSAAPEPAPLAPE